MEYPRGPKLYEYDLYSLFGLDSTATFEQIKKAYEVRKVKMHPSNVGCTLTTMKTYSNLEFAWWHFQQPNGRSNYDTFQKQLQEYRQEKSESKKRAISAISEEKDSSDSSERPGKRQNQSENGLKSWQKAMIAELEQNMTGESMDAVTRAKECFEKVKAKVERHGPKYWPAKSWDPLWEKLRRDHCVGNLCEMTTWLSDIADGEDSTYDGYEYLDEEEEEECEYPRIDSLQNMLKEINLIKSQSSREEWLAMAILEIFKELEVEDEEDDEISGNADLLVADIDRHFKMWEGLDGFGADKRLD